MADETKLRSLKDFHSAIAGLAAHYIPKHEMADYFEPEALRGAQTKPSYGITEEQRGIIETILMNLLERKTKTVSKKGKAKEVTAGATESLVMAAKEDLPAMLRNDADNYQNLVHLHPAKVRRFVTGAKNIILKYLENNQNKKSFKEYGVADAITAVKRLDKGLENRVIGACKKEIRNLESDFRAEVRDAGKAWRQVGTLERKSDRLERKADKLKMKKEELEGAVAALEAEQSEAGSAYNTLAKTNTVLTGRVAKLEADYANLQHELDAAKQELADTKKDHDADVKELGEAYDKLNSFEDRHKALQEDLEKAYAQLESNDTEIENLCEAVARTEREKDEAVSAAEKKYEDEKSVREQYETAFTVLNARYQARFAELGSMVAEWYAFTEKALQSTELSGNEQLKGLRSRNKKLAVLVTDLIEESKSGKRVGPGQKDIDAPWHEQEEASIPTLEDAEGRYAQLIAEVKSEHQREVWGWMYALDIDAETPAEIKQEVYSRFLATNPQNNYIAGVAQCNLGTILAENRKDYAAARAQYELAVEAANAELAEKPGDEAAEGRLRRYIANIACCDEQLDVVDTAA